VHFRSTSKHMLDRNAQYGPVAYKFYGPEVVVNQVFRIARDQSNVQFAPSDAALERNRTIFLDLERTFGC